MARAYIIGNGPSRKDIDLETLQGKTFGCNALYRDFTPDYLLSGDAGVIKEICKTDYPKDNWCIFPDTGILTGTDIFRSTFGDLGLSVMEICVNVN